MAGRAAAPLPRSARSQPPALRAPLSLLLSPALGGGGGGGSSLLGSLAPVIRGAGLGAALPAPPATPPRHPGRGAPREPRAHTARSPTSPGTGAGARAVRPGPGFAERRGVPATHRLLACGRTQACVIHVPRDRPARAKGAPCLLGQSPAAKAACLFPTQFTRWDGGAWMLGVKARLRPFGAGPGYSPPPS